MQTYQIMVLGVTFFLYAYARPYKTTIVNIVEMALLAYFGVFLMLAQVIQQEYADNIQLDETSVDSCGKPVPSIGPEWIVVGVLYFLPVTVLLFLLGRWISSIVVPILRYVEATISCVHVKLKSVINYVYCGDVHVWCVLCFSHDTIRKKLFRGAQEARQLGPRCHTHSTTNWRNVTEATIELSQQRSSSAEK